MSSTNLFISDKSTVFMDQMLQKPNLEIQFGKNQIFNV